MKNPAKHTIPVLLILLTLNLTAQWEHFALTETITTGASFFTSDELGNLYVTSGNTLTKYGHGGNYKYSYSNLKDGEITFLDAGDPFKILVFYQDFGIIEWLDNTLSPIARVNLNDLGLGLASLACSSRQSGIWLYLPQSIELVRLDQHLNIDDRTGNITKATGLEINPDQLLERDNKVYLNDPGNGILLFDKYGTYYKLTGIKGLHSFQVYNRKIIFHEHSTVSILDPETRQQNNFNIPSESPSQVRLSLGTKPKKLFVREEGTLKIFSME